MRILLGHNSYQQPGGEDAVFRAEWALLERHGHVVRVLLRDNASIRPESWWSAVATCVRTTWSASVVRELIAIIDDFRPQIAHFTNTFPLISPAAYYACRSRGVPVVQTVQNYRLICPAATLYRGGQPCEDCIRRALPWPAVWHGCYRGSRAATAAVSAMLSVHRILGTWREQVDAFVAATRFSRRKLIEGGIPKKKIIVKPNFVDPDPGIGERRGGFALFAGRLTAEKGVLTLLRAWSRIPRLPLRVAGDGPLRPAIEKFIREHPHSSIEFLGWQTAEQLGALMGAARFLVFPSEWYEGFPTVLVQAFARGLPVVAANVGGVSEIVREGCSGILFPPGNEAALAHRADSLWSSCELRDLLSRGARAQFESEYTAEFNYTALTNIYAIARRNYETGSRGLEPSPD